MASNYTENYGLCQWEATDQVLRTEFNEGNAKMDTAIAENATAITALTAQLAQTGNCRIETFTYTGTGTYGEENPTRIQFSGKPVFFMVYEGYFILFGSYNDVQGSMIYRVERDYDTSTSPLTLHWSGTQVSFYNETYASYQGNVAGRLYRVLALFAED